MTKRQSTKKVARDFTIFDEIRFDIDPGRLVGFEGDAQVIIAMHGFKPDKLAWHGVEITVFYVNDEMCALALDVHVYCAYERWLLKCERKEKVLVPISVALIMCYIIKLACRSRMSCITTINTLFERLFGIDEPE